MGQMRILHPLDETIDHLLLAGLLERDGELFVVNLYHLAVAKFLMKYAAAAPSLCRVGASGELDKRNHSVPCIFKKLRVLT
jgi:hypothetical protein